MLNLRSVVHVDRLKVAFVLPSGLETKDATLVQEGSVSRNERTTFACHARVSKPGKWQVQAIVDGMFNGKTIPRAIYALDLVVPADGLSLPAVAETEDATARAFVRSRKTGPSRQPGTRKSVKSTPGTITVVGCWMYEDAFGEYQPVKFATIELADFGEPLLADEHIAWGQTDDRGYFTFETDDWGNPIQNVDGLLEGTRDVKVKIYCQSSAARVSKELIGKLISVPYWGETTTDGLVDVPDGTVDIGTRVLDDPDKKAVWYILNNVYDEYQWVKEETGYTRPQIGIWWPAGSISQHVGPNLLLHPEFIEISKFSAWLRSTHLHEYAHAIMFAAYGNRLPQTSYPDYNNDGIREHFIFSQTDPSTS
ncbi:MAG: hypothetical protein ABIH23_22330, partial [bacterium]